MNVEKIFNKSGLKEIKGYLIDFYGKDKSEKIYSDILKLYQELIETSDYRNSKAIEYHLNKAILPTVAIYKAMIKNDILKEEAFNHIDKYVEELAIEGAKSIKLIDKLPFSYEIFIYIMKKMMKNQFPEEGWETDWIKDEKKEQYFKMSRCLYCEIFSKHQCSELVPIFCRNDEINFGGLKKVKFVRTKTLASGEECCDFRFLKI